MSPDFLFGLSANGLSDICFKFFLNDSIELLEITFDGRAFHSLAVVGKTLCPNVLDECLVGTDCCVCVSNEYCV